jgi:hypothetical protein
MEEKDAKQFIVCLNAFSSVNSGNELKKEITCEWNVSKTWWQDLAPQYANIHQCKPSFWSYPIALEMNNNDLINSTQELRSINLLQMPPLYSKCIQDENVLIKNSSKF